MYIVQNVAQYLAGLPWYCWSIIGIILVTLLGYLGCPFAVWLIAIGLILGIFQVQSYIVWGMVLLIGIVYIVPAFRRTILSLPILRIFKIFHLVPKLSETERIALEVGTPWIEKDIFSGKPNLAKLIHATTSKLTEEEKAYLDGPVEEICNLTDDWQVWKEKDLPPQVWEAMKKHRIFGMIIPKQYGGLEFSATAHSEVIAKLLTRSMPLCITAMVPNSLGPAELLVHYGTKEQKDYYLPRLATGEEMPCFALTEPMAGSDAGSISSNGIIFKGENGSLYIRLEWNKRYITLAAIATILGLAFKLRDPENLLGRGENLGITCALIPTNTPGVILGQRHDAMGVPFYNCPTSGKEVVVPISCIVGGIDGVGHGWKMLMECLSAGRGISLPAQAVGSAKMALRYIGAYACIRRQFGVSIGKFEGIAEVIGRVAGLSYLLDAARRYTLSGLDNKIKPPVISSILKYNATEIGRKIVQDSMDVVGGAGISRGPRNVLAHNYIGLPIAITVEGANILTRTLIVFAQSLFGSHPYIKNEIIALERNDLYEFDKNFWSHIRHVVRNFFRSFLLSITHGYCIIFSSGDSHTRSYYRKIMWASATFAWISDWLAATLGSNLKVREMITGRLADILSHLYFSITILARYEAENRRKEDLPFVHWSMKYCLYQIQTAFDQIFRNLPLPFFIRIPSTLWSRVNAISHFPSDRLHVKLAELVQIPGEQRDRLTANIFLSKSEDNQMHKIEKTFAMAYQAIPIEKKIKQAIRQKKLEKHSIPNDAYNQGIITEEELTLLKKLEKAIESVIQVDSFSVDDYKKA